MLLIALAGLQTGCATYQWVSPTKSKEQLSQDSYICERDAALAYPAVIISQVVTPGHYTQSVTQCQNTDPNNRTCTTTPGRWVSPITSTSDVNRSNREQLFASCMQANGWRQIRVD